MTDYDPNKKMLRQFVRELRQILESRRRRPRLQVRNNTECPVCLDEFIDQGVVYCHLQCGNKFHTACLLDHHCPICRFKYTTFATMKHIPTDGIHRLPEQYPSY